MLQSSILKKLKDLCDFLKNAYLNSFFHRLFCKADAAFCNTAVNSGIINAFLKPCSQSNSKDSKFINYIKTSFEKIKSKNSIFVKWILNSKFIGLILSAAVKLERTPFKIIGLFGIGFFTSNIIYQLLLRDFDYILIFKVFALVGFIIISRIETSFKRALRESFAYKLFRKYVKSSGEVYVQ